MLSWLTGGGGTSSSSNTGSANATPGAGWGKKHVCKPGDGCKKGVVGDGSSTISSAGGGSKTTGKAAKK